MDKNDTKEILDAVATLGDRTEERLAEQTKEIRKGFEHLDARLSRVEEELVALSKTVDSLIEGDALGHSHITLTRDEYDAFVSLTKLPNRFA